MTLLSETGGPSPRTGRGAAAVIAVVLATAILRVVPVLGSDFPLNDGGLFYAMARDMQRAGLTWPATTSYGGALIPFAYPPLGPLTAALLGTVLPFPLIDWFRWLPLIFACLAILPVYGIGRELLPTRFHALSAVAAFAVVPESYEWAIEGGGVTRAPGFFFALVAIYLAVRWRRQGHPGLAIGAALVGGLAMLFHPNAGLFTAVSVLVLTFHRPLARWLVTALAIIAGVAIASAPWWIVALLRVGPSGLLSAAELNGPLANLYAGGFRFATFSLTGEAYMPWVGALALLGLLWSLSRRAFLLPAWLACVVLTDQRLGLMSATVSLGMLAAIGLADVVIPAVCRIVPSYADEHLPAELWRQRSVRWTLIFGLEATVAAALLFSVSPSSSQHALPEPDRQAMDWVSTHTPESAEFVVVTGDVEGLEGTQEWFPVLSGRQSPSIPQGAEWLGAGIWRERHQANAALQACAGETAECLRAWLLTHGRPGTYVFVPKGRLRGARSGEDCCLPLRETLRAATDFTLVYDDVGASILWWSPASASIGGS